METGQNANPNPNPSADGADKPACMHPRLVPEFHLASRTGDWVQVVR